MDENEISMSITTALITYLNQQQVPSYLCGTLRSITQREVKGTQPGLHQQSKLQSPTMTSPFLPGSSLRESPKKQFSHQDAENHSNEDADVEGHHG